MTQIGQTSSESGSPKLPDYNSLYGSTDYLEDPDCWSPEDDVILQAYQLTMKNKLSTVDTMSQMSVDSSNSSEPFGYLKRVIVTPAVYPRLDEFLHFDIQSTGQKSHCVNIVSDHRNALF